MIVSHKSLCQLQELKMIKKSIKKAMQRIAIRKPGKSRLVYDKVRRTIVIVSGKKEIDTGLKTQE